MDYLDCSLILRDFDVYCSRFEHVSSVSFWAFIFGLVGIGGFDYLNYIPETAVDKNQSVVSLQFAKWSYLPHDANGPQKRATAKLLTWFSTYWSLGSDW